MPGFYSLSKEKRIQLVEQIHQTILNGIQKNSNTKIPGYFSDEDTYIRKSAYLALGRIYFQNKDLQKKIISLLQKLLKEKDFKIRQTVINAAGEIGISEFESVEHFFDTGLFDTHHSVRNAVIGSVKKMGEKNPRPVLKWAKKYLHHADKEVRREICHGIELRGRKFPQNILPMLKELEFDNTARVSKTLVHVLGQIAYKKGCLATVIEHLNTWKNKKIVESAIEEIIDVHHRYRNFSVLTQEEAIKYIAKNYRPVKNKTY
ncbi:MAG TPA: HEAT repeat domain-containing protein [Bacteroidia bacterium]|jgi:HEAT repeat protein|nr:HEAT repeat domain-containing protein [Bacteroidia bacterium]